MPLSYSKEILAMVQFAPVSMRLSPQEREVPEVAAEQSRTNLIDFIRRKAVEAAEIRLVRQNVVTVSAKNCKRFESWANQPAALELIPVSGAEPAHSLHISAHQNC